jgi:hypothetical protein
MDAPPCADCTAEKQCDVCKTVEEQANSIETIIDTFTPDVQTIALGIVAGLYQIQQDQKDIIAAFISKVVVHVAAHPELKQILEGMAKCYLTPWQYDLTMRCLNPKPVTLSENAS